MSLYLDNKEEFGFFLKNLREAYGYSKADIAKKLYVKAPAISQLEEKGTGVCIDRLIYLAELYELSFDDFLNGRSSVLDLKKDIRTLESICKNNRIDTNLINEDNKEIAIKAYIRVESFLLDSIKNEDLESDSEVDLFDEAANYFDFKIFEKEGCPAFSHKLIYDIIMGFKDDIEEIYLDDSMDYEIIDLCNGDYELLKYYADRIPEDKLNKLFNRYYGNTDNDIKVISLLIDAGAKALVNGVVNIEKTLDIYREIIAKLAKLI